MQKNEIQTHVELESIYNYVLPVLIYKEEHDKILIKKSEIPLFFSKCRKCLIVTSEKRNKFGDLSSSWQSLMRDLDWTEEDLEERMTIVNVLEGFDDSLYEYVKYNIVWSEKYPYKKEGFKKMVVLDQNKDSSQWNYLDEIIPKTS